MSKSTTTATSYISVTDQFCGAGGSSLGATVAGAEIVLAMNHWKKAIETHGLNFPTARHVCTDIHACDPKRYPKTTMLITSPECVNHTLSKGKKRKHQKQYKLWDGDYTEVDEAAEERSRATMWDVVRFAEQHDYQIVIVENVVEARSWKMWESWLHAMTVSLEYNYRIVYFNSMFAHPTPQSRDRMYCVFWKRGNRAPNLDFYPPAYCPKCEHNIEAVQSWKNPNRHYGKYRQQYLYLCPKCATTVEPYYYCAYNIIDWSLPIERIGDRKHPLKDKTLARIKAGLEKYSRQGVLLGVGTNQHDREYPLAGPLPTQTGALGLGLGVGPAQTPSQSQNQGRSDSAGTSPVPFLVETAHSHSTDNRYRGLEEALPTQSSQLSQALVTPPTVPAPYLFNTTQRNDTAGFIRSTLEAAFTQTTGQTLGMVVPPPLIVEMYNNSTASPITDALATVVAGGNHHDLLIPPFLMGNYTPGTHRDLTQPAGAITTVDHNSLITPPEALAAMPGAESASADPGQPLPLPFISSYYKSEESNQAINEALATVTTVDRHALVVPFIVGYYSRDHAYQNPKPLTEPLGTTPAQPRHYLVQPAAYSSSYVADQELRVEDCGFRMLRPHEIGRAMAFPDEYKVVGNSREKVKQYGNAVTPPIMQMLMERCLESLG